MESEAGWRPTETQDGDSNVWGENMTRGVGSISFPEQGPARQIQNALYLGRSWSEEFLQIQSGCNSTTRTVTHIFQVSDFGLDLRPIRLMQWLVPERIVDLERQVHQLWQARESQVTPEPSGSCATFTIMHRSIHSALQESHVPHGQDRCRWRREHQCQAQQQLVQLQSVSRSQ